MSVLGQVNGEYLVVFTGVTGIILGIGALCHRLWIQEPTLRTRAWAYLLWSLMLFFCLFGSALWDIERTEFLHFWSVAVLIASSFIDATPRYSYQPIEKILALVPLVLLMPLAYVLHILPAVFVLPFMVFIGRADAGMSLMGFLSLVVPFILTYVCAVLVSRLINAPRGAKLAALRRSPFR